MQQVIVLLVFSGRNKAKIKEISILWFPYPFKEFYFERALCFVTECA